MNAVIKQDQSAAADAVETLSAQCDAASDRARRLDAELKAAAVALADESGERRRSDHANGELRRELAESIAALGAAASRVQLVRPPPSRSASA